MKSLLSILIVTLLYCTSYSQNLVGAPVAMLDTMQNCTCQDIDDIYSVCTIPTEEVGVTRYAEVYKGYVIVYHLEFDNKCYDDLDGLIQFYNSEFVRVTPRSPVGSEEECLFEWWDLSNPEMPLEWRLYFGEKYFVFVSQPLGI